MTTSASSAPAALVLGASGTIGGCVARELYWVRLRRGPPLLTRMPNPAPRDRGIGGAEAGVTVSPQLLRGGSLIPIYSRSAGRADGGVPP